RIHVYSKEQAATIAHYANPGPTLDQWAAYVGPRPAEPATTSGLRLTGTCDGRDFVSEARYGATLLLRWQEGELVLSRGNVEMARAPLAEPPEEVYFQGELALRGIALVPVKHAPPAPPALPVAATVDKPAELAWRSETPEKSSFETLEDGRVRLSASGAAGVALAAAPLPESTWRIVDVKLSGVASGAGVYLGPPAVVDNNGVVVQPAGRLPNEVLSFLNNRREPGVCARWNHYFHNWRDDDFGSMEEQVSPRVGADVWVRVIVGAGFVSCWISDDGQHWAHLYRPANEFLGRATHLGLVCNEGAENCSITLDAVRVRELPALNRLLDDNVLAAAPALPEAQSVGDWLTQTAHTQPADASTERWRLACAVKTLGAGCPAELAQSLIDRMLASPYLSSLTVDERLAMLNELALVTNPWQGLPDGRALNLPQRYVDLAQQAAQTGESQPWTWVRASLMRQPALLRGQYRSLDPALIHAEILNLAQDRRWEELARLCAQLRYFAGSDNHLREVAPLAPWAASLAQRQGYESSIGPMRRLASDWRHPLVEDFSKDAYNVMAEFQASLDSKSFDDAAKMIASLDPRELGGLLPSTSDSDLLVSVPTGVAAAMQREPELADVMRRKFAPLGRLRVNQSIAAGDAEAVRVGTIQFQGTEAAGIGHRWLGDRALVAGEFAQALSQYQRASETATAGEAQDMAPRIRLAAAMLGQEAGSPAASQVTFGETDFTAPQFESLAAELRSQRAAAPAHPTVAAQASDPLGQAPPPGGYQAQRRGRLDGEPGENPGGLDGRVRERRVPWLERQLGLAVQGDMLYVNNRFHVAAYDLARQGQRRWQSPAPPDRGRTHDWTMTAMRPLVVGERIIVRQLQKQRPII
ncbi:MAG: hypothetical protein KDA41_07495, partial [Planctomycetales bacterium]|nr:hypothetical protein [Planctomycetales bacterium]